VMICCALTRSESCGLGSRIHTRFARVGGVDLDPQALRSTDGSSRHAVVHTPETTKAYPKVSL
jgi:hypothetical protein